jgi:hypothetical protein
MSTIWTREFLKLWLKCSMDLLVVLLGRYPFSSFHDILEIDSFSNGLLRLVPSFA